MPLLSVITGGYRPYHKVMGRVFIREEKTDSTNTISSPDLKKKKFCPVLKVTVGQEMPSH